ncbi:hypothetical protein SARAHDANIELLE_77 [Hafnia phage vB_HpaM_SarahDanielle]|uniref:Uncharacterized protein n=1 Tax=Hafnia phage vB_HpaM_SarahDanielle TaxID=2836113 RepID=A0AAE7WA49_9CAUD|nr:hypothetical protein SARAHDANIELLE_77 [Hafnia phage vB_HpaM_SarahDanielle]
MQNLKISMVYHLFRNLSSLFTILYRGSRVFVYTHYTELYIVSLQSLSRVFTEFYKVFSSLFFKEFCQVSLQIFTDSFKALFYHSHLITVKKTIKILYNSLQMFV